MKVWARSYQETEELLEEFSSPLYVYDQAILESQAKLFSDSLKTVGSRGVRNFFAVKALPNPHVLSILYKAGMGFDCSSIPEVHLALRAGASAEDIIYTSNNTQDSEFKKALETGAMINFDDISLVRKFLATYNEPLPIAFCRYNPGDIEFEGVNEEIIGKPSEAKYGMPKQDIKEAYRLLKESGVTRFGLHTMLLSNERDYTNHLRIAQLLFELAHEISSELGIDFEMINLGGGFGVAYDSSESEFDVQGYGRALAELYDKLEMQKIGSPKIITENGRWVTAEAGYLLTRVINRKETHRTYVGVDATMANLMRPGMYGSYHYMTALSDRASFDEEATEVVDVVGSLCENNDKFALQRKLPVTKEDDIIVIHSAGAHSHTMGFQYNGKLRSAEVLLSPEGSRLIRRAETEEDYFATLV